MNQYVLMALIFVFGFLCGELVGWVRGCLHGSAIANDVWSKGLDRIRDGFR